MVDIIITLLLMLVVFAVIVYILNTFVPIEARLKNLIMLILGVLLLIWLIMAFAGAAPLFPYRQRGP